MRSVCNLFLSRGVVLILLLLLAAMVWHGEAQAAAQLTLTWTDNSNNEDGFRIERKEGQTGAFAQIAVVGVDSASYIDSNLPDGTTYCYRVRAFNVAGDSAYSNEACGTTNPPDTTQPAISGVSVSTITSNSATITWTSDEPADTQIEYGPTTAYGSVTALDPSLTTNHSQTLTGLSPSTLHHYRVTSKDAAGNQGLSGDAVFTTLALPSGTLTQEWGNTPTSQHPNTVEDTFINLDTQNYSLATQLNTYTWPADQVANAILLKWDLSAIPQGSTIQSATVHLYLEGYFVNGGDSVYDISVHQIINKNPMIARATGYTYDGSNPWTPNNCCRNGIPMAQADIAAAEDVQAITKTTGYKTWTVTPMVQDWVANPSTNFGMLINSDPVATADSNRVFSSNEHSQADQRPRLIITYTSATGMANQPPVISPISHDATDVDPNIAGLQIWEGTTVTYSGTVTDPDADPITWEWRYTVDGGSEIVVTSGNNPTTPVEDVSFNYSSVGSTAKTYGWILRANDGQASAESTLTVQVLPQIAPTGGSGGVTPPTSGGDQYGGYAELAAPSGATGFFRVEKVGDRWTLVSPDGNAFWMRAVYGVDITDGGQAYVDALKLKYDSPTAIPWWTFVTQAVRRLRTWGFNALGEYHSAYAVPVGTDGRTESNPEKLPFIRLIRPSWQGITDGRFNNIIAGTDPAVYTGSRSGIFADVFDPAFEALAQELASDVRGEFTAPGLANSPWLIGTTIDDANDTYGFGQRPDAMPSDFHSHLGWIAAVTAPTQGGSTVFTKLAFRDFLRQKYPTLAALNGAWGSTYTSWDSDGGWPNGTGVLDESGRNPWMGQDFDQLSDLAPQVKADLDEFLETVAEQYFSVLAAAVRAYTPNHLILGPAGIGAGARPRVLRAAGRHLDVLQVWTPPDRLDLVTEAVEVSSKPVFVWSTFQAQGDSPLAGDPGWGPPYELSTQEARGQAYATHLQQLLTLQTTDGAYPVVGIDWWAWTDMGNAAGQPGTNFGLVTNGDNAYDGKEAIVALGTDPWGYSSGGEQQDYGDFLTQVTQANTDILAQLLSGATETVCHRPGTSSEQNMTLPPPYVPGHLGHGDTDGPCAEEQSPVVEASLSGDSGGASVTSETPSEGAKAALALDPITASIVLSLVILAIAALAHRRARRKVWP